MNNQNLKNTRSGLEVIDNQATSELPRSSDIIATGATQLKDERPVTYQSDIKSNDGFSLLRSLLDAVFFFPLFEYFADRRFSGKSRTTRIGKMVDKYPCFYRLCMISDYIVRGIVVIVLIWATVWLIYKAFK